MSTIRKIQKASPYSNKMQTFRKINIVFQIHASNKEHYWNKNVLSFALKAFTDVD